ncbi:MAG: o-succinylbenzoate synthase, partial [Actinomycetes bacterium]|nr:o-succinylbenzoate synthase [Actinomycetes bacterium]
MSIAWASPLRARFRSLDERDGLLLRGPAGWAEFSPFWEYDDEVAVPWLRAALEAATLGFPAPLRDHVTVNVTVPAVGPERAAELVRASQGCTTAKVKVAEPGQGLEDEVDRLAAVRAALGPDGHIRIDSNGAWTAAEAISVLPVLDRAAGGLQYAEQPCRTVAELAEVRRRVAVPIAADESIRRAADPFAVKRAGAADVVVLKVQPLGGVR